MNTKIMLVSLSRKFFNEGYVDNAKYGDTHYIIT